MLVPVLNAIAFMFALFLFFLCRNASGICNRFLLLFLYIIIVLSVRIFLTSEDVSWFVLLLYFILKCCFMVLFSER